MRKFWRGGGSSRSFFPPSAHPPAPLPLLWYAEEVTSPQREGDCLFFQKGEWPPSPFCIPQRDFPARRGYA